MNQSPRAGRLTGIWEMPFCDDPASLCQSSDRRLAYLHGGRGLGFKFEALDSVATSRNLRRFLERDVVFSWVNNHDILSFPASQGRTSLV